MLVVFFIKAREETLNFLLLLYKGCHAMMIEDVLQSSKVGILIAVDLKSFTGADSGTTWPRTDIIPNEET